MARATLLLLSLCALAAARKYQGFDEDRGKHSDDEGAGSAPPTSPNDDIFDLWIFPRGCLATLGKGILVGHLDVPCTKRIISKALGYGIIAGACIVKLPQVLALIASGTVEGVSPSSAYMELVGYVVTSLYHVVAGSPFSAYGESVIVAVQSALIVFLLWAYDWPGVRTASVVVIALAVSAQATLASAGNEDALRYVQLASIALFVGSRGLQVKANIDAGSTGQLAFLTLLMNVAGSAARIFTSSQEVKQPEVMANFIISTVLNAVLLGQYVYYGCGKGGLKAGGKAATPKSKGASKKKD